MHTKEVLAKTSNNHTTETGQTLAAYSSTKLSSAILVWRHFHSVWQTADHRDPCVNNLCVCEAQNSSQTAIYILRADLLSEPAHHSMVVTFLAWEDFGWTFDHSSPALFCLFFEVEISSRTLIRISPQRLSELRRLCPNVHWQVACELVSG